MSPTDGTMVASSLPLTELQGSSDRPAFDAACHDRLWHTQVLIRTLDVARTKDGPVRNGISFASLNRAPWVQTPDAQTIFGFRQVGFACTW
jgi:hypothetical protein